MDKGSRSPGSPAPANLVLLYEALYEQSPISTQIHAMDGLAITVNPAWARFWGARREAAVGYNILHDEQLVVLGQMPALRRGFQGETLQLPAIRYDPRASNNEGEPRWIRPIVYPLKDAAGTNIAVVLQQFDVTEWKETEARLEEAVAMQTVELKEKIRQIEAQQREIAELSTPLFPILDHVVVMPVVGAVDARRAQRILTTVLDGVVANRATVVILDITGVPIVDSEVASAIVRAAQAVRLLGAQSILTGIRPEVAQTLVGIGVELTGLITRGSLQDGIAHAMRL